MIVKNLKVDTYLDENGTMTILYKISEGISEKSYGITIAKMVGFPNEIVKEAENVLESFERTKVDEKELMALNVLLSCQDSSADEIRFFLKNIPTNKLH
jgi:DNA mismatch repair ATPase MutS